MNEEAIFGDAIQLRTSAERAAFLDQACGDDAPLRRRVDALLKSHEEGGNFLDEPAAPVLSTVGISRLTEQPGTTIGRYRLLELIGEGGFGDVYMAEQTEPVRRQVALKIIKLGMDTRQVVARFEAERQVMALMDHPCIAKVMDAGSTESGRPYFVMELVDGKRITDYCDGHRLPIRARLELFAAVCDAVDHAHSRGVIHRDIKPSNVLVTHANGEPHPKVIDFGVSKATQGSLEHESIVTQTGQFIGTPQYMSPEQADMSPLDIGPRSDVYSLGVLLYELLTGTTPFNPDQLLAAGIDQMRHIIRETLPLRPSARLRNLGDTVVEVASRRDTQPGTLNRTVTGDLDWITLKALAKDPRSRYATARELAEDVHNFLQHKPIQAKRPTLAHRLAIWSRRHRPLVWSMTAAAAIVLLVVTLGAISVAGKEREGRRAAETAQAREAALRKEAEDLGKEVTGLLASSKADRAHMLCEKGELGRGIIWFARSLEIAPDNATDLEEAIRANLAAWGTHLHRLQMVIQAPAVVRAVALSPNGSHILTGDASGAVRLWDVTTGQPKKKPLRQEGPINAVAFSPDGSRIVTGGQEVAQLWNAATGKPLKHQGSVTAVAFSPDGLDLVTGSTEREIGYWEADTGKPTREPLQLEGKGLVVAVRFTRDGVRALVAKTGSHFQLFDAESGDPIGPVVAHGNQVLGTAISPDGSKFVTAGYTNRIQIWEAAIGKPAREPIIHPGVIHAVAISPDGCRMISGGNTRAAMIWDMATGESIGAPLRQRSTVSAVAFSQDGTHVLTASRDGAVRLWEVASGETDAQLVQHEDGVLGAAFSRDGLRVLTEHDGMAQVRDGVTGKPLGKPFDRQDLYGEMHFGPDGTQMLLGVWTKRLMDLTIGEPVGRRFPGDVGGADFSPDGSRVLTGFRNGTVILWDANTRKEIARVQTHQRPLSRALFSPDGSRFLTGSYNGTTRLWDTDTLGPIGEPMEHESEVKGLAYGPHGHRILVGCADGTVRLWNLATRKPIGPPIQRQDIAGSVAFSPDGSRLLICSLDQTVQLWDAMTLKPIGPCLQHDGSWAESSFSPDGSQILVSDWSGRGRLWDAPPGPLEGEKDQIMLWAQLVTGLELDDTGGTVVLDGPAWQKRFQRLQAAGEMPVPANLPAPVQRPVTDFTRAMDLALSGLDSAEEGDWDEASAAFSKAIEGSGNSRVLRTQIARWCRSLWAGLIGKQMELSGTTIDGAAFDWGAYSGKHVLVGFWNTSSDLCRTEMLNVRKNYELYHDRGFDVVGISTDQDRQAKQRYAQPQPFPWVTLPVSQVEFKLKSYYAVLDDPAAMLVDAQGMVISIEAHGGKLDKLLEELLGPPYLPLGQQTSVNIEAKANGKLTEALRGGNKNEHLAELPRGEQTLGGVKFTIADALIHLIKGWPPKPQNVEGIQLNRKFARLYILHGASNTPSVKEGTLIGQYKVHYQDETADTIPIVRGQDVRDWWNVDDGKAATRGRVVWTGSNPSAKRRGMALRLFLSMWENPHPDKKVVSIDYISTGTGAVPFCIAMTVEAAAGPSAAKGGDALTAPVPEESNANEAAEPSGEKETNATNNPAEKAPSETRKPGNAS